MKRRAPCLPAKPSSRPPMPTAISTRTVRPTIRWWTPPVWCCGNSLRRSREQTGSQVRTANRELTDEIAASRQEWLDQWLPLLTTDEVPLNPYRVIWEIMHTVDLDNTIVTHESGSPREQVSPFWEARAPRSFIGWGKSTQLGYSLGLAMGAQLGATEKLVINFTGDTAFGMVGLDLETAVRENLATTTVVLNNSTMAIYPDSRMPTAVARYNTKQTGGNYADRSRAMGAWAERVTDPDQIARAMRRAQERNEAGAFALLECLTEEKWAHSKYQFV